MPSSVSKEPKVIVVGYSSRLIGGVTYVTNILLNNFTNMKLHPYLYCYSPKYKAIAYYLFSVCKFAVILCNIYQRNIIHLVIGSTGDVIRSVPYIWLSKIMGLKVCAQYQKSADIVFEKITPNLLKSLIKTTFKLVNIHCFPSKRLKLCFEANFPYSIKSMIIPNAPGDNWINIPVLPRKERYRDIVFLGRWSWEKGVNDLVESMSRIKSDVICEIYTDVVPTEAYKNCTFHSWVDEKELMDILRTAKLLVLPSYAEAYPTVLLDAAACGTPFIASDVAGIPDIAEESGAGCVFEVGKISRLTDLIDQMLADEMTWQEMSRNGKAWSKSLTEENIKRQWLDLYSLLDK